MSSDDCKKLLKDLATENSWPVDSKWKRQSKRKEGNVAVREFENQYGHKAMIREEDGNFYLLSSDTNTNITTNPNININISKELPDSLKKTLTHEKLFRGLISELVGIKEFTDIASQYYKTDKNFNDAIYELAETGSYNKLDKALKKYNYESNASCQNTCLTNAITMAVHSSKYDDLLSENFYEDISADAVDINYDLENVYAYFKSMDGLEFATIEMGGDWELPVYAIIYWSEKDQKVKGFFPLEKGNIYNVKENSAYGSEMENYAYNQPTPEDYEKLEHKYEDLREKIEQDSEKHYKKALKEGFKQWKDHLLATEI